MIEGFFLGFKNSFNPYNIAVILVFLIYISRIKTNTQNLRIAGIFFVLAFGFANYGLIFGVFDGFLSLNKVNEGLRFCSLILAVIFILRGVFGLFDWVNLRKGMSLDNLRIKLPFFVIENVFTQKATIPALIKQIFISIGLSFLCVMIGSLWPHDYSAFVIFMEHVGRGGSQAGYSFIISYLLGFCFILLIIWLSVLFINKSTERRSVVIKNFSVLRILTSGIFLSNGVGLIFLYCIYN